MSDMMFVFEFIALACLSAAWAVIRVRRYEIYCPSPPSVARDKTALVEQSEDRQETACAATVKRRIGHIGSGQQVIEMGCVRPSTVRGQEAISMMLESLTSGPTAALVEAGGQVVLGHLACSDGKLVFTRPGDASPLHRACNVTLRGPSAVTSFFTTVESQASGKSVMAMPEVIERIDHRRDNRVRQAEGTSLLGLSFLPKGELAPWPVLDLSKDGMCALVAVGEGMSPGTLRYGTLLLDGLKVAGLRVEVRNRISEGMTDRVGLKILVDEASGVSSLFRLIAA